MKNKAMVFVISCMFLLGMAGNVLAVNDTTGDGNPLDLASAEAVTSNRVPFIPPQLPTTPDDIKLCVQMAPGSHLPGIVIFDFDVDSDTATGGGSILTGVPASNCGSVPCKDAVCGDDQNNGGFDFYVVLALRSQGDTANGALCSNCEGPSRRCVIKGAEVACTEPTCYLIGDDCNVGDPNCFEIAPGSKCTNCAGDVTAFPLADVCGTTPPEDCRKNLIKGEWYVSHAQQRETMVGNIQLRNTYDIKNGDSVCATLPWGIMITQMWTAIRDAGENPNFDVTTAQNNPPKFQVGVYFDPVFPVDRDDLFSPGLILDVNDWMPDTDCSVAGSYNEYSPCAHNSDGSGCTDVDVDGGDVGDFLAEFGRSGFVKPCPNCVDFVNDQTPMQE
jgi:hypothetical protein